MTYYMLLVASVLGGVWSYDVPTEGMCNALAEQINVQHYVPRNSVEPLPLYIATCIQVN